jgi:hypothetical protein
MEGQAELFKLTIQHVTPGGLLARPLLFKGHVRNELLHGKRGVVKVKSDIKPFDLSFGVLRRLAGR